MNQEYLALFMEKTSFPQEARKALSDALAATEAALIPILNEFEKEYNHSETDPMVKTLAENSGISEFTLWMIILILASKKARPLYPSEKLFWDTFTDLRYKLMECYDLHGIWGNFVSYWYPIFYKGTIVKLGRMEYEVRKDVLTESYTIGDITLGPGDTTIHLHIPTCPEDPFTKDARMESYRKAFEYFCKDGKPLVCICASWLLYSEFEDVFPVGTNIYDFRKEFIMISNKPGAKFGNAWRVFGKAHTLPPEELPENTSMQRAFKKHYLEGKPFGNGTGVIIFDGKKLLSQN